MQENKARISPTQESSCMTDFFGFWQYWGLNWGPCIPRQTLCTWATLQPFTTFNYLLGLDLTFVPSQPGPSYLCFLHSWDERCAPPCPATSWDRVSLTFCWVWPRSTILQIFSAPLSSWDFRHKRPCLVSWWTFCCIGLSVFCSIGLFVCSMLMLLCFAYGSSIVSLEMREYVFLIFLVLGLNSGPSPWVTPPTLFLWSVFHNRVLQNYLRKLASNRDPLISAS
jgi:hypothetical protein